MILPSWREAAIGKQRDRSRFDCGDADMNDFLRRFARQSHEQGEAKSFLAVSDADPPAKNWRTAPTAGQGEFLVIDSLYRMGYP